MTDHTGPDWPLLADYLADDATPEERARIEGWVSEDPERRALMERLHEAWAAAGDRPGLPFGLADIEEGVLPRIAGGGAKRRRFGVMRGVLGKRTLRMRVSSEPASRGMTRRRNISSIIGIACVGGFALAIVTTLSLRVANTRERVATKTYTTSPGQVTTVDFASVHVTLGPATTVSVHTRPSQPGYAVTLVGQALFTVSAQHGIPFIVQAGNTVTRVLGTTFFVRRYAEDHGTRVMVRDGRVGIAVHHDRGQGEVALAAGAGGWVTDSGAIAVTRGIAVEDYLTWTVGRLVFQDAPVREVLAELSRTYNVELRLADSTKTRGEITLTVPTAQWSIRDVLDAIVPTLDAHYVRSGRVITIVPGRSPSRISSPPFTPEPQYGR